MPKRLLPFISPSLRGVAVTAEPEHVMVLAVPRSTEPCCPACSNRSHSVHGTYERHLADLPCQGRSVGLCMRLRRLRCRNPACPRRTFSETPPDVAAPHARCSRRLHDLQRHLGLALGGAPAAQLAHRLDIPASPSTVLRIVRAGPSRATAARDRYRRVGLATRAPLRHGDRRSGTPGDRRSPARSRDRSGRRMAAAPSRG